VEDRRVEAVGWASAFEAIFVNGKVPTLREDAPANCEGPRSPKLSKTGQSRSFLFFFFFSNGHAIREIEKGLCGAGGVRCLLFDGSFRSENEMESAGTGTRLQSQIGSYSHLGTWPEVSRGLSHLNQKNL